MHKSLARKIMNRVLHLIAQFAPGAQGFRPFLHKLRGVKILGGVFIGDQVYMENEYPEKIELHDGVQIALRSIILCHFRGSGEIVMEKSVWVGANCVIAAAHGVKITIGEGSVVAAASVVTKSIPPFTSVGGAPAKPIARVTVPMTLDTTYEDFKNGLRPL